ncbi:HAUS augmin-like complex subunit 7 [Branchiostoma belcheri]|nr:HAUS augmin-like complex subunit 7 [Branchiostoma belcheri]
MAASFKARLEAPPSLAVDDRILYYHTKRISESSTAPPTQRNLTNPRTPAKEASLDCPYLEGVEESWITQLIFTPGEHRLRLLQWLFSRIDPKLSDIVEGYHSTQEREQRLLFSASILGLCKKEDLDVVRGTCSFSVQASFVDQLLDMVCIIDSSQDATQRAMSSPGHISESRPLEEQAEADCHLMDRLSRQYTFQAMFSHKLDLLPPDIKHSVEKGWGDAGHQKGSGPDPPDVSTLLEAAAGLNRQLEISTAQLQDLQTKYTYGEPDPASVSKVSRTLGLVLSELAQLLTGFSYCYEQELRPWCNRAPPVLSELGPAFRRVHSLLTHLTQLLGSLDKLKTSYRSICQGTDPLGDQVSNRHDGLFNSLASISQSAALRLQDCMSALDQSVRRSSALQDSTLLASTTLS